MTKPVEMVRVLGVYQVVEILQQTEQSQAPLQVILSYEEEPGVQAIANTAPDRPPVPGKHGSVQRDHEYKRLGTLSVLAGMDLVTGHVHHHSAHCFKKELHDRVALST